MLLGIRYKIKATEQSVSNKGRDLFLVAEHVHFRRNPVSALKDEQDEKEFRRGRGFF